MFKNIEFVLCALFSFAVSSNVVYAKDGKTAPEKAELLDMPFLSDSVQMPKHGLEIYTRDDGVSAKGPNKHKNSVSENKNVKQAQTG